VARKEKMNAIHGSRHAPPPERAELSVAGDDEITGTAAPRAGRVRSQVSRQIKIGTPQFGGLASWIQWVPSYYF
jgi:hypothetical protein